MKTTDDQTRVPPASPGPGGDATGVRPGAATRADVRSTLGHLRTEVDGRRFALKLALCALLTGIGAVLATRPHLAARVPGVILLGCMFAHAAELQHQTLHRLGFRGQRANRWAGVLLGLPMLISFSAYRATHLRHHRDLGTPANREFFDYGDQYGTDRPRSRTRVARDWLVRFSMLHHYGMFLADVGRALRGADHPGETATTSRRIRHEHLLIVATLVALTAVSALVGSALVGWLWLAPLLVAGPVHAMVELPEHFRCETLNEDPFANTRTIRSNRLMTWYTNGNNFHVEHHLMPNLPIERLPDLHQQVRHRLLHFHPSYVDFFRTLVRR
ncbi:fatty acid desaturase [Micromonospora sp. NPDC002296]|uniref:fatty acid desaturase family protein n=1 Tax=Micromonospora sp. NPDC002296 TaxID=3154271 RepID=UPI0033305655